MYQVEPYSQYLATFDVLKGYFIVLLVVKL